MNTIVYRISKCFWKESFYGMVWYGMLCYGMESMVCYEISMLCYEICMLCYALVYVVKNKHSATVPSKKNLFLLSIFKIIMICNNIYINSFHIQLGFIEFFCVSIIRATFSLENLLGLLHNKKSLFYLTMHL